MRIEKFRIQGFKSIADLTVEGLSDINVFFGLNDVGKSNIFQALDLWYWFLRSGLPQSGRDIQGHEAFFVVDEKKLKDRFGPNLTPLGGEPVIKIDVTLSEQGNLPREVPNRMVTRLKLSLKGDMNIPQCEWRYEWKGREDSVFELSSIPPLHIIDAARRLQSERRPKDGSLDSVGAHNLKQAIFYAYLSSNLDQKRRLKAIRRILAEAPFDFGQLDIALDPKTDEIDIGFIRAEGRLPIENLGSGSQQLLLILGQVFLNDYPLIALEEPEMNLSPQHQENLMVALRKLMQNPAVKLEQMFISTHSPHFEFAENFYDVSFAPETGTQVRRATKEQHDRHFAITPTGENTGSRLNSQNQVTLYDGVIQDMDLHRGDLVIFVRNDAGRWEIRSAEEIAIELKNAMDDSPVS